MQGAVSMQVRYRVCFKLLDSRPHEQRCLREDEDKTEGERVTWINAFGKPAYILHDSFHPINGLHELNFKTPLKLCTDQMLYWPTLHRWKHAVMSRAFL